jgi:predicted RNase H-like HicB family nuclease
MMFHVTLEQAEDGWIVAECPALPGCVSQGKTEKEALENVREAITAWLWAEDQKAVAALAKDEGELPFLVRANLSVPQHKELSVGTLRSLIRSAGMTVEEFLALH